MKERRSKHEKEEGHSWKLGLDDSQIRFDCDVDHSTVTTELGYYFQHPLFTRIFQKILHNHIGTLPNRMIIVINMLILFFITEVIEVGIHLRKT